MATTVYILEGDKTLTYRLMEHVPRIGEMVNIKDNKYCVYDVVHIMNKEIYIEVRVRDFRDHIDE